MYTLNQRKSQMTNKGLRWILLWIDRECPLHYSRYFNPQFRSLVLFIITTQTNFQFYVTGLMAGIK